MIKENRLASDRPCSACDFELVGCLAVGVDGSAYPMMQINNAAAFGPCVSLVSVNDSAKLVGHEPLELASRSRSATVVVE